MEEVVRFLEYAVHFKHNENAVYFQAYPVQDFVDSGGGSGFAYISKENEPDWQEVFEEGKCLMKFEGSFVWRGVWEGRLYFTDTEYWGEELAEMAKLYEKHIVPKCKQVIKEWDTENLYEE